MNIDDFVKLLLGVAISASLLGVSIQLMKLFGTLNDILNDSRVAMKTLGWLIIKISEDYVSLKNGVIGVLHPIAEIISNIAKPLTRVTRIAGKYIEVLADRMIGK